MSRIWENRTPHERAEALDCCTPGAVSRNPHGITAYFLDPYPHGLFT